MELFYHDWIHEYSKLVCFVVLVFSAFYSAMTIILPPFFDPTIDIVDVTTCALVFSIHFIQLFNSLFLTVGDIDNVHYIFLIIVIPFMVSLHFILRIKWRERVQDMILNDKMRNQLSSEGALYTIYDLVRSVYAHYL